MFLILNSLVHTLTNILNEKGGKTKTPKIDKRIVKSKQLIKVAFLNLLKETEYSEISVLMVAERSGVNRGTIYKHYKDKEDLLNKTLQRGAETILRKLELYKVFDYPTDMTQEQLYLKLSSFPPDYLGYSNSNVNPHLFLKVQKLFCAQAEVLLRERYFSRFSLPEKSKALLSKYMSYALFGILTELEQINPAEDSVKKLNELESNKIIHSEFCSFNFLFI